MVDEVYPRLTCAFCRAEFPCTTNLDGARRANQPSHCSKACRSKSYQVAIGSHRTRACASCGRMFAHPMRNKIYCSKRCCKHAHRVRCGLALPIDHASISRAKELRQQRSAARQAVRQRAAAIRGLLAAIRRVLFVRQQEANAMRRTKKCEECGEQFYAPHLQRAFCSGRCRLARTKRSEAYAAARRISRSARKALLRTRTVERFDPLAVFERDGWTCQICGIATPQRLRGSYEPDAPELDHIVALSRGGAHSMANTQCACRSCNGTKGAGPPVGRLDLIFPDQAQR